MFVQIINEIFNFPGGKEIIAIVLFLIFGAIFYSALKIIFFLLKKIATKTKTTLDDILLEKMQSPAYLLAFILSIFFAINIVYPDFSINGITLISMLGVTLIVISAFIVDRLIAVGIHWYKEEMSTKTDFKINNERISIIQKVFRIAVYLLALMMVLGNLGLEITPLIAGLGIASLSVALALQDSLGNFFAGMNITIDRSIRTGDFIIVDQDIEGTVQEMGWRSTKIITPQNRCTIIPNTKLAQNIITNCSYPYKQIKQTGSISVSCNEDVTRVSNTIKNAINKTIKESSCLSKNFEPSVTFSSLGKISLNFKFTYTVENYKLCGTAADEINRAIFYEFKKDGIELPMSKMVFFNPNFRTRKK